MDVLKFISCVRHRDCIYNKNSADYRQRDVVFDSWRSIAREMDISVIECKEKWHNLRSNYMRERKKALGPGVKKWHLLDAMSFLEPHHCARNGLKRRSRRKSGANVRSDAIQNVDDFESSTPQNVTSTEHFTFNEVLEPQSDPESLRLQEQDIDLTRASVNVEPPTSNSSRTTEKCANAKADSDRSDALRDTEPLSPQVAEGKYKSKRRQNSLTSQKYDRIDYEFLKQVRKLSRHLNEPAEDPDRMFLLSLLPLVKQLSPRDNLSFRVQVQQMLEQKLTK